MATSSELLSWWLIAVAALRVLSVVIGIFSPNTFKTKLIDRRPDLVHPLFGRLFAAWTTITCCLCVICSYNINDKPIYAATLLSFLVALVFFLSEMLVYKTVSLKCAMSPMVVAGVSTAWMTIAWSQSQ